MHSLCAGRILLQNTHSHKHISTPRVPFARVKGHLAARVLTSIAAAHSWDQRQGETYQNLKSSASETFNLFRFSVTHVILQYNSENSHTLLQYPHLPFLSS